MPRWSEFHALAGNEPSRVAHPTCFSATDNPLLMRPHASHVGSSVMMLTGPVSSALANSDFPPPDVVGPPSEPGRTTTTVITTVTTMTATTAKPINNHFSHPRRGGGGGGHGGCEPYEP